MNTSIPLKAAKVRGNLPPPEYQLAHLTENLIVERHRPSWSIDNPGCKWSGITCDEEGHVIGIKWYLFRLSGDLQWEFLPHTVVTLNLNSNKLVGKVPFTELPPKLTTLCMDGNFFYGQADFTALPDTVGYVVLSDNNFSGEICLTKLPQTLYFFNLARNQFSGTLDLTNLPSSMNSLFLHSNRFRGHVSLSSVPKGLSRLFLNGNPSLYIKDSAFKDETSQVPGGNVMDLVKKVIP